MVKAGLSQQETCEHSRLCKCSWSAAGAQLEHSWAGQELATAPEHFSLRDGRVKPWPWPSAQNTVAKGDDKRQEHRIGCRRLPECSGSHQSPSTEETFTGRRGRGLDSRRH